MFSVFGGYSLFELFSRADVRILLWLNHFGTAHPALQTLAGFFSGRACEVLGLVTLIALWFWPKNEQNRTLFGEADLTRRQSAKVPVASAWLKNILREDEYQPQITRVQSRAQVLLWGLGAGAAYVCSRLLAEQLALSRPFASYWTASLKVLPGMASTLERLQTSGAFPSGHAAVAAALVCALFYWNRRVGLLWLALVVFASLGRIAAGLHYPSDVLGGGALGLLCVWPLLSAYRGREKLFRYANNFAGAFDAGNAPYCYLLYFLMFLVGLEAAVHFSHVLQMVLALRAGLILP